MGFKSFKVVHFEQLLDGYGDDDDNSEWKNNSCFTCSSQVLPGFTSFYLLLPGDFGSEFEGLRGGNRMMSLVTLFGGLKNVFKASICYQRSQ